MTIASLFLALVVTAAADSPSGEPVLLDFHADWCGPCKTMRPEIAKLAQKQYPIRSIDIDQSPEVAEQYQVKAVPTFIVADRQGRVLARTQGVTPALELAKLYNEAKLKAEAASEAPAAHPVREAASDRFVSDADRDPNGEREAEAAATPSISNPRPWETVVRIKMHLSSKEWGFGSGTIIYSDAQESIILTCAHIFRDKHSQPQPVKSFRTPISVDLFGSNFVKAKPATLACEERDIPGEAIDYDFNNDVGLIRIRPGRRLPASRVVPESWKPKKGMKMFSVGCSHGNDATAWDTHILDPLVKMNNSETKQSFYEMKCAFQPSEGRSGGGLYTSDGFVAGVCDFADPAEHVGLYATPSAIHRLLDRARLTALYKAPTSGSPPGSGAMLASAGKSQPLWRGQSPVESEGGVAEAQSTFSIPAPGMFQIPNPETRVAANTDGPKTWQASERDEVPPTIRPSRRPDRNSGEVYDPGAKASGVLATDIPLEPSAESAILDLPTTPQRREAIPAATASTADRKSAGKWRGVHTTRPRPAD